MGLETITSTSSGSAKPTIDDLNVAWPLAGDDIGDGAAHLRNIKNALKFTFENLSATVVSTAAELNLAAIGGTVSGALAVKGTLTVSSSAVLSGDLSVKGNVSISGSLNFKGLGRVYATNQQANTAISNTVMLTIMTIDDVPTGQYAVRVFLDPFVGGGGMKLDLSASGGAWQYGFYSFASAMGLRHVIATGGTCEAYSATLSANVIHAIEVTGVATFTAADNQINVKCAQSARAASEPINFQGGHSWLTLTRVK